MGQGTEEYEGHFSNYAEYSKTYRSWMVGYGIGGPVLLLTGKDAPQALAQSPWLGTIVTLFVFGVAIQIVLALVNKWAAWHMYRGAWSAWLLKTGDPDYDGYEKSRMFHVWDWINRQSWIDLCCDIGALASFSIATWIALSVLLSPR
jgi:hypothetical protein